MKLYRICTEHKNVKSIEAFMNHFFSGYTIIEAKGYWKKQKESSLIIEVISDKACFVYDVATWIKIRNKQQAVMVQEIDCGVNLL